LKNLIYTILGFTVLGLLIKAHAAKNLVFEVTGVTIKQYQGKYQLFCKAQINNPTSESIAINAVNLNFFYGPVTENKLIGSIDYKEKLIFTPKEKTSIALPVKIDPKNLGFIFKKLLSDVHTTIATKGTVNFGGLNIPIEKEMVLT